MKRIHVSIAGALAVAAIAIGISCSTTTDVASRGKVGAVAAGQFPTVPVGYDPSVSGWPGAVGNRVQSADHLHAWVRNGSSDTAWAVDPSAGGGGTVSSASAPLSIADGGVMQIATASTTDAGTMSASDKLMADTIRSGWETKQALYMLGRDAALTQCVRIPLSPVVPSTTAPSANDGACEGGCVKANNAGGVTFIGLSVAQTASTLHWAITYRASFLGGGASGHDSEVGLINAAATHAYNPMRRNATSTTKYTLSIIGPGSQFIGGTINADGNPHDFTMRGDGTHVFMDVDGVVDVSTGLASNMQNEPLYLFAYSQTIAEALAQTPAIYCHQ